MSKKLKPCPFCGGEAQLMVADPEDNEHILFMHFGITCKKCHILMGNTLHGVTDFFDTVDDAIRAWNARANTDRDLCRIVKEESA